MVRYNTMNFTVCAWNFISPLSRETLGAEHYDYKFYKGKVLAARYYLLNVVPEVSALADIVKLADTSVLAIEDECFDY